METATPLVVISVLNWNNYTDTISCITSLQQQAYASYRILVIDNHSTNDSVKRLREAFPELTLIANSSNIGYAGAHSLALRYAFKHQAQALYIINNDAVIFEDTLAELVKAWQANGPGLYGSITFADEACNIIDFAGGFEIVDNRVDPTTWNLYKGQAIAQHPQLLRQRQVADVEGSSLLIPMQVIQNYGFMRTYFFLYAEETDWCLRLLKQGVPSVVVPSSRVVHRASSSFSYGPRLRFVRNYYKERNQWLLYRRHPDVFGSISTGFFTFKRLGKLLRFFARYYTRYTDEQRNEARPEFYKQLGRLHAWFNIRGKYLKPEAFID